MSASLGCCSLRPERATATILKKDQDRQEGTSAPVPTAAAAETTTVKGTCPAPILGTQLGRYKITTARCVRTCMQMEI